MTPALVLAQLLDLPQPFLRPSTPFAWIYQALAGAESTYTLASDGMAPQVAGLPSAQGPWLTTWGEILGISRQGGESDGAFAARVERTLLAPVGTLVGVQTWSRFILNTASVFVAEMLPNVGYTISIPAAISASSIVYWLVGLARIRPAGVPFQVQLQTGPLMLGTYSYLGAAGFAGAYLGAGAIPVAANLQASTGNAISLLPGILLTDPTLNGRLLLGLP